jgi:hypothetical protein
MKRSIFILIVLTVLTACYSQPINIVGTYQSESAFINFKPDYTVTFYYVDESNATYTWILTGDKIRINSFLYKVVIMDSGFVLYPQYGESVNPIYITRY